MPKTKPLWEPNWDSAPKGTIAATFNADGSAWWWNVRPTIKGSEKRPWDLKWRGPVVGEGYAPAGRIPEGVKRGSWKQSYLPRPEN